MKTTLIFLLLISITSLFAQPTDTLISYNITKLDNPDAGYIMLGPLNKEGILCLFDNNGDQIYVRKLPTANDGQMLKMTNFKYFGNGVYSFFSSNSSTAGQYYILNNNFSFIDSVSCKTPIITDFHDMAIKPNGNYIVYGRKSITVDMSKKVKDGNPNATIGNMIIQEIAPDKSLVAEWNMYDHVDILEATSDVDLTLKSIDPFHINSIFVDIDGNLIVSARHLDQIIKIAWPSGQILWRIGGTSAKANDFKILNDTKDGFTGFSHQHDVKRLANGNLLLFDNGQLKADYFPSRVVEYIFNESAKTITKTWEFFHPDSINSQSMGNAERLPNGNTFIGWGGSFGGDYKSIATECRPDGSIAFEMEHQTRGSYRALRYVLKNNSVSYVIANANTYDFNNSTNVTGVTLQLSGITGSGYTSVERHDYSPHNLSYSSSVPCILLNRRYVINSKGIVSVQGKIIIKLPELKTLANASDLVIFYRNKENTGSFAPLATTLDSSLSQLEANISGFGEFMVAFNTSTEYPPPTLTLPINNENGVSSSPLLHWTRNGSNEFYRLQVSQTSNFDSIILDTNNLKENRFTVLNLSNYKKYYWRISAFTQNCSSAWSLPYCFTTFVPAPNLELPSDKQSDVPVKCAFSWKAVTGATQYRIQISGNQNMLDTIRDSSVVSTELSLTIDNLKYYSAYYWRVSAAENGKFGPWSDVWSFTTVSLIPVLTFPVNQATSQPINGVLRWEDIGPGFIYRVQVASDSIFRNIVLDESGLNSNYINYKDFNYITDYYWRIKAETIDSKSDWSERWKFRTIIHTPELLSPKNHAKSVNTNGYLACAMIKGATKYEVELAKDSLFKNIILTTTDSTGIFKYNNLDTETTYYWHVRMYDEQLPGSWSALWAFKSLKSGQVASPDPVYPFIRTNTIPEKFDFKWGSVSGADSYDIQLSTDSIFASIIFEKSDQSEIFTGSPLLAHNIRYFWRAKSKKATDSSEWSDYADFYVCLDSVTLFIPEDGATDLPNNPFLVWDNAPDAQLYQIQIARDSAFADIAMDLNNLKKAQANAEQLNYNTVFYWKVRSFNQQNGSLWSSVRSFKTQKSTGVEEYVKHNTFAYPNPADEFLILDLRELNVEEGLIKIYNTTGMIFNEIKFSSTDKLMKIPLIGIPENMYIIELVSGTNVYFEKFIIAR